MPEIKNTQLLFERIFVHVDAEENKSPSGLIIPKESTDMLATGTILALGHLLGFSVLSKKLK